MDSLTCSGLMSVIYLLPPVSAVQVIESEPSLCVCVCVCVSTLTAEPFGPELDFGMGVDLTLARLGL